jgi:ubiquinone/menaquinone biosynthesis C-methylase UbiE
VACGAFLFLKSNPNGASVVGTDCSRDVLKSAKMKNAKSKLSLFLVGNRDIYTV